MSPNFSLRAPCSSCVGEAPAPTVCSIGISLIQSFISWTTDSYRLHIQSIQFIGRKKAIAQAERSEKNENMHFDELTEGLNAVSEHY